MEITIKRPKWNWMGHTMKKPQANENIAKQALEFNVAVKEKIVRPTSTWKKPK